MKPIKVLLIDDDEDYRILIRDLLKEFDLKIEMDEADSSAKGMAKLQSQPYDCVLIDYLIPGISGFNVIKEAKKSGIDTPFIIITGYGNEDLAEELIKEGATDYLSKDQLNLKTLQNKITAALSNSFQDNNGETN